MSYKTGFYEGRLGIGLGSTMGMGDGNPRYSLDINGDIRLTGSIVNGDGQVLSLTPPEYTPPDPAGLDGNNRLMYNNVDNSSASSTVTTIAIGDQALSSLTSGTRNIALGYLALRDTTTGHNNIGIGGWAGLANTGSHNIFMGHQVGYGTGAGSSNVGLGQHAILNLTSGNDNVAIGHDSAYYLTTGSNNVCLGAYAGGNMTTSGENVFMGSYAGRKNTTGAYHNVGLGYGTCGGTGSAAVNVQNNVCIGQSAGGNLESGYGNVYLGQYAGLQGTTGAHNIAIGKEAGRYKTDKSGYIAIGQEALYSNMGGAQCIAIGYQALKSSAGNNHYDNVAIGYQSMRVVTSAVGNTCLGYVAGQNISSGWYNVLLGKKAGEDINTGYRNICIGMSAGNTLTTTHDSVYIGTEAGQYCDQQNIAIGYQSLRYRCNNYNIAIGYQAMVGTEHTGRAQNVCIGYQTLNPATSASFNVAVGHQAAMRVTSGNYNTLVGYQAGQYVMSGGNNICLGKASGTYIYYGSSNICIGISTANAYSGAVQNMSNCICIGTYTGPKTTDTTNTCKLYIGTPSAQNGDTYRGEDGSFIYGYYNSTTLTARYLRINGHLGINCNPTSTYGLRVDSADVYIANNFFVGSFKVDDVGGHSHISNIAGGGRLEFNTSGYTKNLTLYNGKVGIGTTDPKSMLDVNPLSGAHNTSTYVTIRSYGSGSTNGNQPCGLYFNCCINNNVNNYGGRKQGIIMDPLNGTGWGTNGIANMHFCLNESGPGGTTGINASGVDCTLSDSKMVIQHDGNVGIGTTSPDYPLHVNGWVQMPQWSGYYVQTGSAGASTGSGQMITIQAQYGIWVGSHGLVVSSDQRIKTNISEVPDNLSLQKLRDISCCYYEYKDKLGRGSEKTIGFIAQHIVTTSMCLDPSAG